MMYQHKRYQRILLAVVCLFFACHSADTAGEDEDTAVRPQTPVRVSGISTLPLTDYIELNATSAYLQKSLIRASTNGYLQKVSAKLGQQVRSGEPLFVIITKEAKALGNSINSLDPEFKFSGLTAIRSGKSGFITEINNQEGDYVQEGGQLAVISNQDSFVFLLDLPYELKAAVKNQRSVEMTLPDGEKLTGMIGPSMPAVDSVSQTERLIIRVKPKHQLPVNLVAKVRLIRAARSNTISLPKEAVLANETQDEFWIMKLINDSTAVKVPVKKGLETNDKIEILSPAFSPDDRVITTGNYGLADTARIKIMK